jgi:HK97 family phage major capsid protein
MNLYAHPRAGLDGIVSKNDPADKGDKKPDIAKQIADDVKAHVDTKLENVASKDDLSTLNTKFKDLEQSVKEIKVKDIGDDLGLGRRYKSLRNLKTDREAYDMGCAFIMAIAKDTDDKFVNSKLLQRASDRIKAQGTLGEYVGKAQIEGTNTLGGYLVNDEFSNRMIDLRETYGVGRRVAHVESMASETKSINRRVGGLTVYSLGEGTAITTSDLTWNRVGLVAKKWGTLTKISSELDEDSIINLGDTLAGEIAYAFSEKEDQCVFNGDGSSTYPGIEGFRSKLKTINGTDEGGGLILQTSNAFADITLTDFHELIGILPQYADTPMTKFVCHRTFWAQVMCRLQYAAGGVSKADIASAGDKTFLGYPVEISQVFPSSDTASVVYCTFGDHTKAATFGDRRGINVAFSAERYFDTDEIAVRGTERFDFVAHDLGTATVAGPVVGLMSSSS